MTDAERILVVTTSHDRIDEDHATGLWLEEFAVPYHLFLQEGFDVTVASPAGGRVPVDPRSRPEGEPSQDEHAALNALSDTTPLERIDPGGFDAVFFPGGHGTMFDLTGDDVGAIVTAFAQAGKPVAAVCHGPAAFVSARSEDGAPFVEGRRLTCFSDEEEHQVELAGKMPFLLESRLREQGGEVETGAPQRPHIVEDGQLVTGQNPASSEPTAKALISRLTG